MRGVEAKNDGLSGLEIRAEPAAVAAFYRAPLMQVIRLDLRCRGLHRGGSYATTQSPSFLGVAAVLLAVPCIVFAAARARNDRHRQDRLSIAFERVPAVRTEGSGLQGSP